MIKAGLKFLSILSVLGLVFFLSACDDTPPVAKESKPAVVQKIIISPVPAENPEKSLPAVPEEKPVMPDQADQVNQPAKAEQPDKMNQPDIPVKKQIVNPELPGKDPTAIGSDNIIEEKEHYDSQGKLDPFKPLIQDKPEENVAVKDNKPKRILTPLEKIDLSQIRLVAVISMKNKKIAMVEEASGKGYEVGIGTFIGKNQGRVSEILDSSIIVKELVKDYKGQLKEQAQEIKLNKTSDEE